MGLGKAMEGALNVGLEGGYHPVDHGKGCIPVRSAVLPLDEPARRVSCNLLVDSGIQGLATDMLCPDTHLPTPADWRDEMSVSASEIEKAKSRTKPETPKHYTEEVLP